MVFRMEKLTIKAQEAVAAAQSLAGERGHAQIDTLHLLAALLDEKEGIVRPLLEKIGANQTQLGGMVQSELDRIPTVSGGAPPQPNADQQTALDAILESLHSAQHGTVLVHGVTGSGKTEVYMRAIDEVIAFGRQAQDPEDPVDCDDSGAAPTPDGCIRTLELVVLRNTSGDS